MQIRILVVSVDGQNLENIYYNHDTSTMNPKNTPKG